MKKLLAIGLLALSTSTAMSAMTGSDIKESVNGLVGWAGIYQEVCGPVPPAIMRLIGQVSPMADRAEVMAAASKATDLIDSKGKDWWCDKVSGMYSRMSKMSND